MYNFEKDIELIKKYFDRKLTEREKEEIEKRMEGDIDFQEIFEDYQHIKKAMQVHHRQKLKEDLQVMAQNTPLSLGDGTQRKYLVSKSYLFIAAAGITALLMISVLFVIPHQLNSNRLFSSYYEPYPNYEEETKRGNTTSSLYRQAFYQYTLRNYKEAIKLFQEILEEDPSKVVVQFYLANAYLASGEVFNAVRLFQELLREPDFRFKEATEWYLALAYLKNQDFEKSQKLLKKIAQSKSFYHIKARHLLVEF